MSNIPPGVHNNMEGYYNEQTTSPDRNNTAHTFCWCSAKVIITGDALGPMEPAIAAFSLLSGKVSSELSDRAKTMLPSHFHMGSVKILVG